HRRPRPRPDRLEPKARAAPSWLPRRSRPHAQIRGRSGPDPPARAGARARRYARRSKEGRSMRFRAVRPSQLGKVDAIVVTLFAGGEPPAWLPRTTKTAIARLQKQEQGVMRLIGVNTSHEETRIVIVGGGKAADVDAERALTMAGAGVG